MGTSVVAALNVDPLRSVHEEIEHSPTPPRGRLRVSTLDPGTNRYDRWIHDNWRAAFDYKALADTLDSISYMTYAQHDSPPGLVAGYPWMKGVPGVSPVARR